MAQPEPVARIEALYRNEWPGSAITGLMRRDQGVRHLQVRRLLPESVKKYGGVYTTSGRRINRILVSHSAVCSGPRAVLVGTLFVLWLRQQRSCRPVPLLCEVSHVRPEPGVLGDCARSEHRRR